MNNFQRFLYLVIAAAAKGRENRIELEAALQTKTPAGMRMYHAKALMRIIQRDALDKYIGEIKVG